MRSLILSQWRRVVVYLGTHCNIGSMRALSPAYSTGDTTVYLFNDAQPVLFLHLTIPSVTSLRVTYFQFPIQSAFLPCRSQPTAATYVVYPISDVAENLGSTFLVRGVQLRGKTELLILTVKMGTR